MGNCVEVAQFDGSIGVRDSKNPNGNMLSVPATIWAEFISDAKAGRFDPR